MDVRGHSRPFLGPPHTRSSSKAAVPDTMAPSQALPREGPKAGSRRETAGLDVRGSAYPCHGGVPTRCSTRYSTLPVPTRRPYPPFCASCTPVPSTHAHAHMAVLGAPKEILGVDNAQYVGGRQYPRAPALPARSSLPCSRAPSAYS